MAEDLNETLERARTLLREIEGMHEASKLASERVDAASSAAASVAEAAAAQQAVNVEHSRCIEETKNFATEATAQLKTAEAACVQLQAMAKAASDGAEASAEAAAVSSTGSSDSLKEASASRDEARVAAEAAKGHQRDLQALAALADLKEAKVLEYEAQLKALMEKCAAQEEEITRLLPGATSAGLAAAYRDRRSAFVWPAWIWQGVFVSALIVLIGLAAYGIADTRTAEGNVRELSELARLWLTRLPIAGALIWLALHAGQEGALARRLEEDYGYKETVAASFQGFQVQMANVAKDTPPESALARLCNDVLATLAAPPGRIYDKHSLAALPSDLVKKVVDGVVDKMKSGSAAKSSQTPEAK